MRLVGGVRTEYGGVGAIGWSRHTTVAVLTVKEVACMMRDGSKPKTQREKAAARELYQIAKESQDLLMGGYDPKTAAERLKEIAERGRVLLPMVGWEEKEL